MSGYLVRSNITIFSHFIGGWPSAFWVFGLVGLVWFPAYAVLAYERPEDHPRINPKELSYIRQGLPIAKYLCCV
jgi:ACS family sodium-dependent inorganic phosphate cotransporter-like MFS transporter 5